MDTREPVRILHLHGDLIAGGGQTLSREWLRASDRSRIDPYVVVLAEPVTLQPSFEKAGISVTQIFGSRISQILRLARYIRAHRIDVVHSQSEPDRKVGHWAAFLTRRPVVAHLHSEWVYFAKPSPATSFVGRVRSRIAFLLRRISERSVVQFVATSDIVADAFAPYTSKPLITVEPGVAVSALNAEQRDKYRDALGIHSDELVIVNLSRLDPVKNLEDFISTVAILAHKYKVRGLIAGQGPLRDDLKRSIQTKGLYREMQLLDPLDDPVELLGAADIFLATSTYESFGISVLEALSVGIPVVGYKLDVYSRYNGACRTVELHDVQALAHECSLLADSEEERVLGHKQATNAALKYSIISGTNTLIEIDEKYAARNKTRI